MKAMLLFLWNRRTTVVGYIQVILGVLAASSGVFSDEALRWIVLANGLLLACLGHYNNHRVARDRQGAEQLAKRAG